MGFFCKDAPHDMTRRVLGRFYAACAYLRMYQNSKMEGVFEFDDCMTALAALLQRSSGLLDIPFGEKGLRTSPRNSDVLMTITPQVVQVVTNTVSCRMPFVEVLGITADCFAILETRISCHWAKIYSERCWPLVTKLTGL